MMRTAEIPCVSVPPQSVRRVLLRLAWAGLNARPGIMAESPKEAAAAREWLIQATERYLSGGNE